MPAAAAAAVVKFVGVAAASFGAKLLYAAVYIVVTASINYGLSRLSQALAGKKKQDLSGPRSREVTVRGTVEPMQMIYGEVRSAGFLTYYGCSGDSNKFLHFVIAYAAHQCEDISHVWLDSRKVADSEIDSDGNVGTSEFQDGGSSKLVVRRFLGAKGQSADSELTSAFAGLWTSNHRGAGVAYVHFKLEKSEKVWPTGAPAAFFAQVKGSRLYDPRKDSTNGGSGSHRYTDATTWEWSANAALAIRDYISGGSRWYDVATPEKRLRFGEDDARIDDAYTIAAANISDEDVTIPPASPTTTQKRYTADAQLSCGSTHKENLDVLKSACVGNVTYVNGKYRIYAGAYDTPEVEITEDDILGPVTIATHPNGEELYNLVTGTFFDESRDWSLSPFPNITNSSFETDDGGQYVRKIELHATRSTYRAQRIAILHLAQSRNKITVRFDRLSPKAMAIAEHETFMVTIGEYGWDQKVFRCLDWEFMPDGFISLTGREESSSVYTDPSVGTYVEDDEFTVDTPELEQPDTPLSLTATPLVRGVLLEWDVPSPRNNQTMYHVYRHTAATPFSSATRVASRKALDAVVYQTPGTTGYFWVTAELNGQESEEYPVGDGVEGTPEPVTTQEIGENAATDGAYSHLAGPVTVFASSLDVNDSQIVHSLTFTPDVDCDIEMTVNVDVSNVTANSGGNSPSVVLRVTQGATTEQTANRRVPITTSLLPISMSGRASVTGGVSLTVELYTKCAWSPALGGQAAHFSDIEIIVWERKR